MNCSSVKKKTKKKESHTHIATRITELTGMKIVKIEPLTFIKFLPVSVFFIIKSKRAK